MNLKFNCNIKLCSANKHNLWLEQYLIKNTITQGFEQAKETSTIRISSRNEQVLNLTSANKFQLF